ncbi:MAG: alpha/beta hydrolase [Deltaproteobacteria bacterium]|nr:alpha/beta hydrolase [Deltaproteobacteria bacterium]
MIAVNDTVIHRMAGERVFGPGRDRHFHLDQFVASVGGVPMAFFDDGPRDGEVIFFTHGLAGNVTHWVHIAPGFVDRYRVVGVDLPGCGETPPLASGYSIEAYTEQVLGLLDLLDIEKAYFVGHSLGGMVSMELYGKAKERVRGMLLVGSAGFMPVPKPARAVGKLILREGLLKTLLPRVWQSILGTVFERDNEYTRQFRQSIADTYDPVADVAPIAAVMSGLKQDFLYRNYESMLDDLQVPLHLMWGQKDRLTPAALLPRLAARSEHIRVELVAECGHMPIIETPHLVVQAVERLIRETRRSARS